MIWLVVVVAWVVLGAVIGLVDGRHGHWSKSWILGAILGPLAIPLAMSSRRDEARALPVQLHQQPARQGALNVLVGVDGSPASYAAAATAAAWFGPQIGQLAIAAVLDFDTAAPHAGSILAPEPWEEETKARAALESVADMLSQRLGFTPTTLILPGSAADALEAYALEHGYDTLVVGCRGRGLSKSVLGSCATRLARRTQVPVLLVPEVAPAPMAQTMVGSATGRREPG